MSLESMVKPFKKKKTSSVSFLIMIFSQASSVVHANNLPQNDVDLTEDVDRDSDLSSCLHRAILLFLDFIGQLIVFVLNSGFLIVTKPFGIGESRVSKLIWWSPDTASTLLKYCIDFT